MMMNMFQEEEEAIEEEEVSDLRLRKEKIYIQALQWRIKDNLNVYRQADTQELTTMHLKEEFITMMTTM
jgi:hypothetical protein